MDNNFKYIKLNNSIIEDQIQILTPKYLGNPTNKENNKISIIPYAKFKVGDLITTNDHQIHKVTKIFYHDQEENMAFKGLLVSIEIEIDIDKINNNMTRLFLIKII